MATAGQDTDRSADEVATALRGADLVCLASDASGDALAATGTLARALRITGTAFQASVLGPGEAPRATEADLTVGIGPVGADLTLSGPGSASAAAYAVAGDLASTPDPTLALAGSIAAGGIEDSIAAAAAEVGIDRRPGVAVPTEGLAEGLAGSTLFHAPFSGDVTAAEDFLEDLSLPPAATVDDLGEDAWRRVASAVAIDAGEPQASDRAATAVERALRPHEGGPYGTIGGLADVLAAAAQSRPGVGLGLALGGTSVREPALEAWREHGHRAHEAVRDCATARYDGLVVARRASMPVGTVARLLAEFVAPEPVVLAVAADEAAVFSAGADSDTDVSSALETAAAAVGGNATGLRAQGRACFDGDPDELVAAYREER